MLILPGSSANSSAGGPAPGDSARPAAPRTLGKYELLRLLARGGMGEVHLARLPGELGFEKKLVIKTIRADLAADPRFVELFAAEAKTAVDLSHPNIAPIYELGRAEDGTLYTAMGWVDGPSLAVLGDRLRERDRPLEPGAALFIVREILDGLAHAHTHDRERPPIVHRDVTPRNVLVERSGRVQIVDFGIAKAAESEARGIMGSAGYMAPEQARGETVDPRADVFSVGCVLYELLTNTRAFVGEGVWMSPSLAEVPAQLRDLLGRALALDPGQRPADADAFRRELAPLLADIAPAFGSRDLAAIVHELFPDDDWLREPSADDESGTPATKLPASVETFATRLRPTTEPDFFTGSVPVLPPDAELDEPEPEPEPDEPEPPLSNPTEPSSATATQRARWPLLLTLAGVAVLAGVVGYSVAQGDRQPTPRPTRARDTPPLSNPTGPSPAVPAPATPGPDLDASAPRVTTIDLQVEPEDAELRLDGEPLDGPPYRVEIDDAPRELEVHRDGHRDTIVALDPAALPASPLVITLAPLEPGQLSVLAPGVAWAEIWLDGEKIGTTPLTDTPVLEGRHKLEVRCTAAVCGDPRVLLERNVKIKPGRATKVSAP